MLHVALAGLLAGSLALSPPDGTGDAKKTPNADKPAAESVTTPGVFETAAPEAQGPESITQDTYAFGVPSNAAPIKLWVHYAYGQTSEEFWNRQGDDTTFPSGEITSQRIGVGAQINVINFSAFKLGAGGQLTVAKNSAQNESFAAGPGITVTNVDSDFGLQGLKVYGSARGRVLGIHGGYIFDFGDETVQTPPAAAITNTLGTSDGREAIFFGADFDVPSDRFRAFGGIDYFIVQNAEDEAQEDFEVGTDILNFMVGAGVKLSVFELGAALQIQTRFNDPTNTLFGTRGIGGHAGTVAPYLRISPPSLPASIFIKGAVQDEYTEFGYAIGGANSPKPKIGFTAGLTIGFE